MRRPWIEAAPLLGAAGHPLEPLTPPPSIWSRLMSQRILYAILDRIDGVANPHAVQSLDRLADIVAGRIHGQAVQLIEIEDIHAQRQAASGRGDPAPDGVRDRGLRIETLLLDGSTDRVIGFVWLNGQGRDVFAPALERAVRRRSGRPHPHAYAA